MASKKKVVKKNIKNMVKKKVVKKNAKKPVNKKVVKKTTKNPKFSKSFKKQLNSNKKASKRALTHNKKQDKEIAKLKEDLAKIQSKNKLKKNTKRVSEYNLFIRRQIKSGLTFEKAVKEWNKYKNLETKQKRKPTAYNQFIGSQMKLGKTFTESVKLWKLAKAGKLGKKGSTKTITKTVFKDKKPKTIAKKTKSKPKVVEKIKYRTKTIKEPAKPAIDYNKLQEIFTQANNKKTVTQSITTKDIEKAFEADDDEIAFRLVQTYFKEIARFGFKKQLTLDEIIDAYIYALARVKRNEHEDLEISRKVKESGMRK